MDQNQTDEGKRPIRVVFLCATGMSSSLIKNKVESLAAKQGVLVDLLAIPSMMIETVDYASADLVLLAPQVRVQLPSIVKVTSRFGLPVETIGFREYGLADAPAILAQILRMYGQRRSGEGG